MSGSDWSQGYVTDASYADKFFRELSPTWLNYVAALNGATPRNLEQPFAYLELGCGFGHSTIANAGAFPHADFHACDFNPEHVDGGERRAAAFGIGNVRFHQASFQELLARDLPRFDFIVLHGVYSWVDADARRAIRRVIYEQLQPGGLVYLSYNCLPGWSNEVPLRKLLLELAATASGDSAERAQGALRSLQQLSASKLRYFAANPEALTAVDAYIQGPSNYLAHEFLNRTWEPFYSIDVADELAEADVSYLGSATLADNHQPLIVDDRVAEAAAKLPAARQRQLAIDFATNQRFRRDVFVRGRANLGPADVARNLNAVVIGSLGNPARILTRARVPRGEIRFQRDFIGELQQVLLRGSLNIGEAVAALGGKGRDATEITRNLIYLLAAGTLLPFAKAHQPGATAKPRRLANETVERVFAYVIEQRTARAIPSEILGNGVEITAAEALGVTTLLAGIDSAATDVSEDLVPSLIRLGVIV
jgi:predicted O-methyltransferase YrrM